MTESVMLPSALSCAARGWPVFPCRPGEKTPATTHGCKDATTDATQIRAWWERTPNANVAIATGHPGPDVLDIDVKHGAPGWKSLNRLIRAELATGAGAYVKTPSGGLHLYFQGSDQHNGTLRAYGIDFRSRGGYVLGPPSVVDGRPYLLEEWRGVGGAVDWQAIRRFLQPPAPPRPAPQAAVSRDISGLVRWVAGLQEGGRNSGLFWAACRALESGVHDLEDLIDAAKTAGLDDREARRTVASAARRFGTNQGTTAA